MWAISYVHITPARYAVDGKEHRKTLYYGGLVDTVFGMCATTWVCKRQAVLYRTKAEATRQAKRLKGNYTIKEIK